MASASRPTARMSSGAPLFAMRSSGSRRASAALAGSRVGNTLSVTTITERAMAAAPSLRRARQVARRRKHLWIDTVGGRAALEDGDDVVDHHVRHLLAQLGDGTAEMRRQYHVGQPEQRARHLGLVLVDVEAGPGDLPLLQRAGERGLVDNR